MPKLPETDEFIVDLRPHPQPPLPEGEGALRAASGGAHPSPWGRGAGVRDFMQYNNAFLAILVIGFVTFSGLAFASEEVRSETIGAKKVAEEGVDNALLLEADLENFKMDFEITGILEDDEQYLISYDYVDLDIADGAWQLIEKTATRRVKKPFRQDLGLYLARQLAQEESARLKILRTAQKEARNEGQTQLVQVTRYSGLIGKVLDVTNQVFPGYEPVKTITLPTPPVNENLQARTQSGTADSMTTIYNGWVENNADKIQQLNGDTSNDTDEDGSTTDESADADAAPAAEETAATETTTPEATETETSEAETAGPAEEPATEPVAESPAAETNEADSPAE